MVVKIGARNVRDGHLDTSRLGAKPDDSLSF
jgi:hypothetical protein